MRPVRIYSTFQKIWSGKFQRELFTRPRPAPKHARVVSVVGDTLPGGEDGGWWILDDRMSRSVAPKRTVQVKCCDGISQAIMRKDGDRLIIEPVRTNRFAMLLSNWERIDDEFPDADDFEIPLADPFEK